ncbi:MAG TPA: guanylate kinase [Rhodospirillaceae bacterium]|nr:MAG: guanylate kinase [Alphaproteobacteria bacterium GWF2_58_20]HAU29501.1 guanylate kinase [Rhodospirillaceae bacterium]
MTEIPNSIARRGVMMALAAPSGGGKSSIIRELLKTQPEIYLSVSATTRAPRPGEVDGKDYHFVTQEKFREMLDAGAFLEHAEVFGNFYGTPRQMVEEHLAQGHDVFFDIDWQGARQIAEKTGGELVRVFILPPSGDELEKRLKGRGQDSDEVIAGRMAKAASEIRHWDEFDYVVVNDVFEQAVAEICGILATERLRRIRRSGMAGFVKDLMDGCARYAQAKPAS